MITRTHAIISLRDSDKSHVHVQVAVEPVVGLFFVTEVVTSVSLISLKGTVMITMIISCPT